MTLRSTKPFADPSRAPEHGLTLVELMVTVMLAAMLSGGLFYVMAGQTTTYSNQVSGMVAQENLWGAMEYLQRQVRLAGYGFGGCRTIAVKGGAPPIVPLRVYNNCNIYKHDPASCVGGSDGPDSFTITHADLEGAAGGVSSMLIRGTAGAGIAVPTMGNWKPCDFIMLLNFQTRACALMVISDISVAACPASSLPPPSGGQCPVFGHSIAGSCAGGVLAAYNDPVFPVGGFPDTTTAVRMGQDMAPRHFAIDTDTNPPRLVTWTTRNPNPSADTTNNFEIVADAVEDLQVSWGCDAMGDGGVFDEGTDDTAKKNDDWMFNVPADTVPNCAAKATTIGAVRITIVSRSANEQANTGGRRPAAEDRAAGAKDRFQRRVLTSTVRTRNLR